jgi:hypothetical protein
LGVRGYCLAIVQRVQIYCVGVGSVGMCCVGEWGEVKRVVCVGLHGGLCCLSKGIETDNVTFFFDLINETRVRRMK